VIEFASMCGATVTKYWNPNVTHVIAATDAQGACARTLKVLMAILNGRWVLNIDCKLYLSLQWLQLIASITHALL
jgi:BRCA1-associated RING domain protein 1